MQWVPPRRMTTSVFPPSGRLYRPLSRLDRVACAALLATRLALRSPEERRMRGGCTFRTNPRGGPRGVQLLLLCVAWPRRFPHDRNCGHLSRLAVGLVYPRGCQSVSRRTRDDGGCGRRDTMARRRRRRRRTSPEMDVECSISGHPTSQKMLSAHEGPPDESNLSDDLVGGDEEYELTELKNVETERGEEKPLVHYDSPDELEHLEEMGEEENLQSTSEENYSRSIKFDIHLANAVSHYPSLYDPLDPNFKSNNYRAQVWKKIAESLLWQNDIMSLTKKWKQLKERYIKRFEREDSQMDSEFQPLWSRMKWLDRHILPTHERTIITHSIPHHSQSQPSHSTQRTFYVDEPQTVAQDVMIGGGQTQPAPSYSTSHRESSSHVGQGASSSQGEMRSTSSSNSSSGGTSYYLLKNSNSQSGGHLRLVSDVQGGGPAGRVTVIPATRTSNGTAVVQLPPGNYPRNQRVQIIHTPTSTNTSYEHRVNVGDPGVTVTERGSVGRPIQLVKKASESLLLDNGDYYQTGGNEQKFIRVIPMHDGINVNQPQSKRMRLIRAPNPSNQVNIVAMNPSTSRHTVPMTTLGEEVIIDDGVTDRIVIDQDVTPESPLLSESPGIGSMFSGHPSLGPPSPSSHPGYLQQSQYDADLQFQQQISSRLTAYDENEKALIKFHIQRILLEARYGQGIIKSILQEEVDLEAGTNGVAHELISQ